MSGLPGELFRELVSVVIAPVLKTAGFSRTNLNWRRHDDGVTQIVNLQRDHGLLRDGRVVGCFTFNLGVLIHELAEFDVVNGWHNASVWDCHIQERLGSLINSPDTLLPVDYWWVIDEWTNFDRLRHHVLEKLTDVGLPYLDDLKTTDAVVEHWSHARTTGISDQEEGWYRQLARIVESEDEREQRQNAEALRDAEDQQEFVEAVRALRVDDLKGPGSDDYLLRF